MDNIETYIIPENRTVIEYLWNMNILTELTNTYIRFSEIEKESWICLGELTEENKRTVNRWLEENAKGR